MTTPKVTVKMGADGVPVAVCSGDFDMDTTNLLVEACYEATSGQPLVVDVTQVTFADSSFLNALVRLRKDCPLTLQGPLPDQFRRLLEMTGAVGLFAIRRPTDPAR
ncbi:STAS domain-containing protein [Streptomyces sp. NPDC048387]|uniref:STAS domain-containing protein n=1 Tax=Streptomyces sp. NPDC048387 TaxID=3365542 RepID=UPI0037214A6D